MIKRFFELQEKILGYYKNANTELLKKAYTIAANAHLNQTRASKEPYITHPLEVAGILTEMKLDEISIAAGLLHDIVEDTDYTIDKISDLFGKEISDIVWGVTKISKISEFDHEDAKAETLKKMIIAMTSDVRVILIKLADRLHNIRTLDALNEEKRVRIAKETLDIYAPIAYRLGMGKIKAELEDLAFKYTHPAEFERITKEVSIQEEWAKTQLEAIQKELKKILRKLSIKGEVTFRLKRIISIYRKLKKQDISLDKVYDLLALRITTSSIENCYALMGEIHQTWRHIPSRWRDFITNPKGNGYQSIHTTVITKTGIKFEIQIRTWEMHSIAEEGIAAHWKYKEGMNFLENDKRLHWFREMIDSHKSNPDPKEFLSLVKSDLTPNEIYVFTPKGKVINLALGSTPIDFAYAIHTEIGYRCKGAIVNEQLVPLKTKLNSGDVVEILTSNRINLSSDWLKYVVTSKARKKIMGYLQKRENTIYSEKGRRVWAKVLREYKKKHKFQISDDELAERLKNIHYSDLESFMIDLGSGKKQMDKKMLSSLFPEFAAIDVKTHKKQSQKHHQKHKLVNIEGWDDIDFTLARCCNPIKGEKIVGYITQNRGLVIHKQSCANLRNPVPSRVKEVAWNELDNYSYSIKYEIIVQDKPGILSAISSITAENESNIRKIETEKISHNLSKITMVFEVRDIKQLSKIFKKLQQTKGVFSILRKRLSEN